LVGFLFDTLWPALIDLSSISGVCQLGI